MTDYRKLFDLTGKTAVVLGAASGIGKSSAEALAALGASVLCADRSLEGAHTTAAAIRERGGVADAAACDAARAVSSGRIGDALAILFRRGVAQSFLALMEEVPRRRRLTRRQGRVATKAGERLPEGVANSAADWLRTGGARSANDHATAKVRN